LVTVATKRPPPRGHLGMGRLAIEGPAGSVDPTSDVPSPSLRLRRPGACSPPVRNRSWAPRRPSVWQQPWMSYRHFLRWVEPQESSLRGGEEGHTRLLASDGKALCFIRHQLCLPSNRRLSPPSPPPGGAVATGDVLALRRPTPPPGQWQQFHPDPRRSAGVCQPTGRRKQEDSSWATQSFEPILLWKSHRLDHRRRRRRPTRLKASPYRDGIHRSQDCRSPIDCSRVQEKK